MGETRDIKGHFLWLWGGSTRVREWARGEGGGGGEGRGSLTRERVADGRPCHLDVLEGSQQVDLTVEKHFDCFDCVACC